MIPPMPTRIMRRRMRRGRAIGFYTIPSCMGHNRYAEHEHHLLSNQREVQARTRPLNPFFYLIENPCGGRGGVKKSRVPKVESPSRLIDARMREYGSLTMGAERKCRIWTSTI